MLTLYYSPGACSLASHIVLEEAGAAYSAERVLLAKGEHRTEAYREINPRGRVPALRTEAGVLTENVAILTYAAKTHPAAALLPTEPLAEARCLSMAAWLSNSVHPSFTRTFRPERFTTDESAHESVRAAGRRDFLDYLREIDGLLAGRTWIMGERYTICDPYLLVFYVWGRRVEMPMHELTEYTRHKDQLLARPAVRKVLDDEGLKLD